MRKIILLIFLAIVLFIAGCGSQATDQSSTEGNSKNKVLTIEITSEGFSPNPIIIGMGDRVTWVNKDTAEHWPASAILVLVLKNVEQAKKEIFLMLVVV